MSRWSHGAPLYIYIVIVTLHTMYRCFKYCFIFLVINDIIRPMVHFYYEPGPLPTEKKIKNAVFKIFNYAGKI